MITGIKQSIADQSGTFGFQFGVAIADLTKQVNVGFTGTESINWSFLQGKIYDNQNNYCGSYLSNQQATISGNIESNSYDYYLNGAVVALGLSKNTGILDHFYVNSLSGNSVNWNCNVVGEIPNISINENIIFATGTPASGYINNLSAGNIRLFSGSCDNLNITFDSGTTGNISPNSSGQFLTSINGANPGSTYSSNYTFYTNFGNFTLPINFYAEVYSYPYTQLIINQNNFNGISGASGIQGFDLGGLGFNTISGLQYINTPFLDVQLSYVSGTTGIFRPFTGLWDLQTGINQNSLSDFLNQGYYNYQKFYNPHGQLTNIQNNSMYINVLYTPNSGIDVALLTITGLNSGIQILITGQND